MPVQLFKENVYALQHAFTSICLYESHLICIYDKINKNMLLEDIFETL